MLAAREYNETAAKNAPGKHYRKGLSLMQLADKFATDDAAREWFESECWPERPECPHCVTRNVQSGIAHKTITHRCRECEGLRPSGGGEPYETRTGELSCWVGRSTKIDGSLYRYCQIATGLERNSGSAGGSRRGTPRGVAKSDHVGTSIAPGCGIEPRALPG